MNLCCRRTPWWGWYSKWILIHVVIEPQDRVVQSKKSGIHVVIRPQAFSSLLSVEYCFTTRQLITHLNDLPADPRNSLKFTTTPQGQHSRNTPKVHLLTRYRDTIKYLQRQLVSANRVGFYRTAQQRRWPNFLEIEPRYMQKITCFCRIFDWSKKIFPIGQK